MASSAWLDLLYARLSRRGLFFEKGWGDPYVIESFRNAIDTLHPPTPAQITWNAPQRTASHTAVYGTFQSPRANLGLPPESAQAHVLLIAPPTAQNPLQDPSPLCIHLASTGDQGFARRLRFFALPLLKHGVSSLILENPLYGLRRPQGQNATYIPRVSDLLIMGHACVEEARSLLSFFCHHSPTRPLAISGLSMGAQMAALASASVRDDLPPIATIPCIGSPSASPIFTQGVLSNSIDWPTLSKAFQDPTHNDARTYMRTLFNAADVTRLPPPRDPSCAILVNARGDHYVDASYPQTLHKHWPGSELRWLPKAGHVSSLVLHAKTFRTAILDALERLQSSKTPQSDA